MQAGQSSAASQPVTKTPSRRRRIAMRLTALTLSSLFACLIAEGALRLTWSRPEAVIRSFDFRKVLQTDEELGHVPRPNVVVDYPPFHASFNTNELGLRGPVVPVARVPGMRRIVVLGDSFAFGHGVSIGDAFPEHFARLLPKTEIVNLGVPGFNLRKELAFFRRIGAQYRPDVVLLALCQNDIRDLDAVAFRQSRSVTHARSSLGSDSVPLFRHVKQTLWHHSNLFAFTQDAISRNKAMARLAVRLGLKERLAGFELLDDNLHASLVTYPPPVRRAWEQVQSDLLRMKRYIEARGGQLVVALIPARQAIEPEQLVRSIAYTQYETDHFDTNKPYRLLTGYAMQHGIEMVNPVASFKAAAANGRQLYLPGDLHFSAAGHALFAESAAPSILKKLDTAGGLLSR